MSWACEQGDADGNMLAWGVRLSSDRKFFLEVQDRQTIQYKISKAASIDAGTSGDTQGSIQQVRGVYTDLQGKQQITDWQKDEDAYLAEQYYRRRSIRLDNITNVTDAEYAANLFLSENKSPKRSSSYTVSDGTVFTSGGLKVPIDEVVATGEIVAIEDWRSVEAGITGTDIRDSWTQEQIVGVEVEYDSGRARLIPASAPSMFDKYMEELARISA
jgi:hypothetical protein